MREQLRPEERQSTPPAPISMVAPKRLTRRSLVGDDFTLARSANTTCTRDRTPWFPKISVGLTARLTRGGRSPTFQSIRIAIAVGCSRC